MPGRDRYRRARGMRRSFDVNDGDSSCDHQNPLDRSSSGVGAATAHLKRSSSDGALDTFLDRDSSRRSPSSAEKHCDEVFATDVADGILRLTQRYAHQKKAIDLEGRHPYKGKDVLHDHSLLRSPKRRYNSIGRKSQACPSKFDDGHCEPISPTSPRGFWGGSPPPTGKKTTSAHTQASKRVICHYGRIIVDDISDVTLTPISKRRSSAQKSHMTPKTPPPPPPRFHRSKSCPGKKDVPPPPPKSALGLLPPPPFKERKADDVDSTCDAKSRSHRTPPPPPPLQARNTSRRHEGPTRPETARANPSRAPKSTRNECTSIVLHSKENAHAKPDKSNFDAARSPSYAHPQFDKQGRCLRHPSITVATRNTTGRGRWTLTPDGCHRCAEYNDNLEELQNLTETMQLKGRTRTERRAPPRVKDHNHTAPRHSAPVSDLPSTPRGPALASKNPVVPPPTAPECAIVSKMPYATPWGECGLYSGDVIDGIPNGVGTLSFENGREYHGQWIGGYSKQYLDDKWSRARATSIMRSNIPIKHMAPRRQSSNSSVSSLKSSVYKDHKPPSALQQMAAGFYPQEYGPCFNQMQYHPCNQYSYSYR